MFSQPLAPFKFSMIKINVNSGLDPQKPSFGGVNRRNRAKFHADRSNRHRDMAVYDFSGWRPSAILDLLYAYLDHPHSLKVLRKAPHLHQHHCWAVTLQHCCWWSLSSSVGKCTQQWLWALPQHEEHLVVFVTAQKLVGIGAVVSIICKFHSCEL